MRLHSHILHYTLTALLVTVMTLPLHASGISWDEVREQFHRLSRQADYNGQILCADSVLSILDKNGDNQIIKLLCLSTAAQAYVKTDRSVEARAALDSSERIINSIRNSMSAEDTLFLEGFYTFSNAQILYSTYFEDDYETAIQYAARALKMADSLGNTRQSIIFGINYAMLCTQHHEEYRYEGAENLYQKALSFGDKLQIMNTARLCGLRYELLGDYNLAKEYFQTALNNIPDGYADIADLYAEYGRILTHINKKSAEIAFKKAINLADSTVSSTALVAYLTYGNFLENEGDYSSAKNLYMHGIRLADSAGSNWNRRYFYEGMYRASRKSGNYQEAMDWLVKYVNDADSVRNERLRKDIAELSIRYETAVKEKIISDKEAELTRQQKKTSTVIFLLILFCVASVLLTILYLHKRASYLTLFRMHQNMLAQTEASDSSEPTGLAASPNMPDDRDDIIFSKIEYRMRHDHLYREPELTLEKAAKAIDSNRTYLSAAIKKSTGLSFSYYINSYRVKEAVSILSDPTNREPLKSIIIDVGFKSQTPFYKLFNEVTGTTPSQWRERHST